MPDLRRPSFLNHVPGLSLARGAGAQNLIIRRLLRAISGTLFLLSLPCFAQSDPPHPPPVRYHYGDDRAWSNPILEDAQWSIAPAGVIPAPPEDSDGFLWVRVRFPVPPSAAPGASPLTLRLASLSDQPVVAELFADGSPVGGWGAASPRHQVWFTPPQSLFPLPRTPPAKDGTVFIAVRVWVAPQLRGPDQSLRVSFQLETASTAKLADGYLRQRIALEAMPDYAICLVVALLGLALAAISFVARRRVFVLSAGLLLSFAAGEVFFSIAYSGIKSLTGVQFGTMNFVFLLLGSLCFVEFIWESLDLGCRPIKYLAFAGVFLNSAAVGIAWIAVVSRPVFAHIRIEDWGDYLRNLLEFGGALWGVAFRPGRRLLAFSLAMAAGLPTLLSIFGIDAISIGSVSVPTLSMTLLLTGCAVAGIMASNAWSGWRTSNELQVQFSAARELQQQLVPVALPPVPGWHIEAAFRPAAEVGGDFYQVLSQSENTTLIVLGDVSGKGLKAAMTGVLAIGALRTLAAESPGPAALLTRLNQQIVDARQGGFITCICALLHSDGIVIVANAGHLSPYRNGIEAACDNGLPLGLASDVEYAETALQLAPGDQITLLTDGVLEARLPTTGELYGFERTSAISSKSAAAIAAAAQSFGQDDDITVLTLYLEGEQGLSTPVNENGHSEAKA